MKSKDFRIAGVDPADGFPSDEMNAAGHPEQDSLTDDGEAAAEVVLIAV